MLFLERLLLIPGKLDAKRTAGLLHERHNRLIAALPSHLVEVRELGYDPPSCLYVLLHRYKQLVDHPHE